MCIENTCVVAASIRSCSRCQANPALALVLIPSSQESAHASPLSPGSMWSEKPASLTPIMYNIIIIYYNIMWDMRTGAVLTFHTVKMLVHTQQKKSSGVRSFLVTRGQWLDRNQCASLTHLSVESTATSGATTISLACGPAPYTMP